MNPGTIQAMRDGLRRLQHLLEQAEAEVGALGGPECAPVPLHDVDRWEEIVGIVVEVTGVSRTAMRGNGRQGSVVWARHLAWLLAREFTRMSCSELARQWGRDHGTVSHGVRTAQDRIAQRGPWAQEFRVAREKAARLFRMPGEEGGVRVN